uniref:Uncharacterized protein n=1 Tax=Acrobeloides nanus TaxID=290746 RepID=A0A914DV50_9BILA
MLFCLSYNKASMVDFDVREDGRGVQLLRAKSHVAIPSVLERRKLANSKSIPDLTTFLLRHSVKTKSDWPFHYYCGYRRTGYRYRPVYNDPPYSYAAYPSKRLYSTFVPTPSYKTSYSYKPKGHWYDYEYPYVYRRSTNPWYGAHLRDTFRPNRVYWYDYVPSYYKSRPYKYYDWY